MGLKAVFTFGLPGAGKSTWLNNGYERIGKIISADKIKETLDPSNPRAHLDSTDIAEAMVIDSINKNESFIADGGGINRNYTYRQMMLAKDRGFEVHLIYFKTPLEICVKRNRERTRSIPVPESEIFKKAGMLNSCLHRLKNISDVIVTVNYFTHKYAFIDMDGTIASYQHIPKDSSGSIDFVNGQYYKHALPVKPMIDLLANDADVTNLCILSAAPDNHCMEEKTEWLKTHAPFFKKENIYYIGNYRYKQVMIKNLCTKFKIKLQDVTIIDDKHSIIEECCKTGMYAMHPSEYLAVGGFSNLNKVVY